MRGGGERVRDTRKDRGRSLREGREEEGVREAITHLLLSSSFR